MPMCSESRSPRFSQLLPPSRERYTPSPHETLRWLLFSPVPTQTTFGFFGSSVMQPIEYEPWLSNMGVNVVPPLTVFHTPPEATAMYQVARFCGWTAMSPMRPEARPGPRLRNFRPARRSALSVGWLVGALLVAGALVDAGVESGGGDCCARIGPGAMVNDSADSAAARRTRRGSCGNIVISIRCHGSRWRRKDEGTRRR